MAPRGHGPCPECCELLATNDTYPVQGFRCGDNAFGFQFHPEVTLEMKKIWTLSAAERLKMPGVQQRGVHLACMRSTTRRSTAGSTASSIAGWRPTSVDSGARTADHRPPSSFSPPNSASRIIVQGAWVTLARITGRRRNGRFDFRRGAGRRGAGAGVRRRQDGARRAPTGRSSASAATPAPCRPACISSCRSSTRSAAR